MKGFSLRTCALLLLTLFCTLLLNSGSAAAAAVAYSSAPRRALLVDKEVSLTVDPVGVVRSVELYSSVTFNSFCEFVRLGGAEGRRKEGP